MSEKLERKLVDKLNSHMIDKEYYSSNTYLQMGAWAEYKSLSGCAGFLYKQAEDERQHMRKIFDYLLERGELPILKETNKIIDDYKNIKDLFTLVYEQEKTVTKSIHNIAHYAWEIKDLATFSFLQWFIEEQREEEALTLEIVNKIEIIGIKGQGLYMIDEFIGSKLLSVAN